MPVTPAHPITVIPFRRVAPFSALVVGSMAPDFLYLVPGIENQHYGHSWIGLFTFCLPAGLAVLWLWHALLKRPAIALAPASQQGKLVRFSGRFHFFPASRFALISAAIFFGALTHVLLDGFTHSHGLFVKDFAFFYRRLHWMGHQTPLYKLLNYAVSSVSLTLMAFLYVRWLGRHHAEHVPRHLRTNVALKIIILLALVAATFGFSAPLSDRPNSALLHTSDGLIRNSAIGMMRAFTYAYLVVALGLWPKVHRRRRDGEQPLADDSELSALSTAPRGEAR